MDVINNDLNLLIENFGDDEELNKRVRSYYRLLKDHMSGRQHNIVIQTRVEFLPM